MRLSPREQELISAISKIGKAEMSFDDDILPLIKRQLGTEFHRKSVLICLTSLVKRLNAEGVNAKRISRLGRSAKAIFHIDQAELKDFPFLGKISPPC